MDLDLNTILLIIAVVLALPIGLVVGFLMSMPRARFLGLVGAVIGDLIAAAAIYLYLYMANPSIDALSYFLGSLFTCAMGAAIGTLLANFIVGALTRGSDVSSLEY
jgi:hypothetical protein